MAKVVPYVAKCKVCGSPVYYYPSQILLESKTAQVADDNRIRLVDGTCEVNKHRSQYIFPGEFTKVG